MISSLGLGFVGFAFLLTQLTSIEPVPAALFGLNFLILALAPFVLSDLPATIVSAFANLTSIALMSVTMLSLYRIWNLVYDRRGVIGADLTPGFMTMVALPAVSWAAANFVFLLWDLRGGWRHQPSSIPGPAPVLSSGVGEPRTTQRSGPAGSSDGRPNHT